MKERIFRNFLISITVVFVSASIFAGGVVTGSYYHDILPSNVSFPQTISPANEVEINQEAGATPEQELSFALATGSGLLFGPSGFTLIKPI